MFPRDISSPQREPRPREAKAPLHSLLFPQGAVREDERDRGGSGHPPPGAPEESFREQQGTWQGVGQPGPCWGSQLELRTCPDTSFLCEVGKELIITS